MKIKLKKRIFYREKRRKKGGIMSKFIDIDIVEIDEENIIYEMF